MAHTDRPQLASPLLHVVQVRPEIPNNAGNIGRTCMATGCALHLVHPLGFETDEKAVRRAGMDYWDHLDVREHESLDAYLSAHSGARLWLTSGLPGVGVPHWRAGFERGDHVLLGTESSGLPAALLERYPERVLRLPLAAGVRGLNVASVAAVLIYEAVRQAEVRGERVFDENGAIRTGAHTSGTWRDGAS